MTTYGEEERRGAGPAPVGEAVTQKAGCGGLEGGAEAPGREDSPAGQDGAAGGERGVGEGKRLGAGGVGAGAGGEGRGGLSIPATAWQGGPGPPGSGESLTAGLPMRQQGEGLRLQLGLWPAWPSLGSLLSSGLLAVAPEPPLAALLVGELSCTRSSPTPAMLHPTLHMAGGWPGGGPRPAWVSCGLRGSLPATGDPKAAAVAARVSGSGSWLVSALSLAPAGPRLRLPRPHCSSVGVWPGGAPLAACTAAAPSEGPA
ncbi:hypothetical protein V8C86DRAFT_2499483 [Haematococcus lacustris]